MVQCKTCIEINMLKHLLLFIISIIASISSQSEQDFCDHKFFVYLIPGGILSEAITLATNGGVRNNFGCHNYRNLPFTQQDLKYRLYTRENPNSDWLDLTTANLINLDRRKPTKIILPGWLCEDKQRVVQKLIRNFLHRYDCNIITIDHRKFSFAYYQTAFCNINKAGELLGDFLCELGLDFNRVHMLGHSLGAHLAGLTGQRIKATCNQVIDRITGLDPAGPIYQQLDRSRRLDKGDARFVDVIHSNMGIYGYYGPLGHVDFYAFGGRFQSNCIKTNESASIIDLLILPTSLLLCSHERAVEYFADSIVDPKWMFQAKSCTLRPKYLPIGTCLRNNKAEHLTMGEDCERNFSSTEFVWRTNKNYAFFHG